MMGMLGAQVWTYWLVPPLFAAAVLLTIVTAVGYYRKVAVPFYVAEQQRRLQAMSSAEEPKPVERLPQSQPRDRMPLAA